MSSVHTNADLFQCPTIGQPVASNVTVQSPQAVTLTATAGANADAVRWYAGSTGGAPFHTGTSYSIPLLSQTAAFYLASYNTTSGCESTTRKKIMAIYDPPSELQGSGAEVVISTVYIYSHLNDRAPMVKPTWVSGNATVLSTWNEGMVYYARVRWVSVGTGSLKLMDGNFTHAQKYVTVNCPVFAAPAVEIFTIEGPMNTPGSTSCKPSAFVINASPPPNTAVRWYNSPSGGTAFHQGLSYSTPVLSESQTFYLTSYNASSGCETEVRLPVTVTVHSAPEPSLPQGHRCGPGNARIIGSVQGHTIQWFTTPESTTPFAETINRFFTPHLETTTTFYARSHHNPTGCYSTKVPITIVVDPVPGIPTGIFDGLIYGFGQADITAQPGAGGNTVRWYASETSTDVLEENNFYLTDTLVENTTFFTTSYNTTTGCESTERDAIYVRVRPYITPANMRHEIIRVPGAKKPSDIFPLTGAQKTTVVSYYDGLMRMHQQVLMQGSPRGKDVVNLVEFDEYGRTPKTYLPFASFIDDGRALPYSGVLEAFYNNPASKVAVDSKPYAVTKYESSPLGRVTEQGGVGAAWQPGTGHTQRFTYTFNQADEVRQFNADGTSAQFYPANTLSKTESVDADNNRQIVFQDKAGKTLLKKQQLDEVIDGVTVAYLETYYIYDDFGRVRYTISPKGVAALKTGGWFFDQSIKDQYAYEFVYDHRGRVAEKKVPGQAWIYYVYDQYDRLVLSQDGLLRQEDKWLFLKYDRKGRAAMQGLYHNATDTTRDAIQWLADALYTASNTQYPENAWHESRGTTLHGYSNTSFPKTNTDGSALEVLSVNYYDHHDFDLDGSDDFTYTPQGLTGENTPGSPYLLPTGSKTRVLGTDNWLYTYVFYDKEGRAIQSRSNNHLSASVDNLATVVYDFEGKLLISKNFHNVGAGRTTTVINKYTYDSQGRILKIFQNNNGAPSDQLAVQYEYNELGQVVDKKLHNTSGTDFLQSIDYRYNIRGQLTSINNSALTNDGALNDDINDYFGMELLYNTTETGLGNTPYYSGNISALKWKGPGVVSGASDQRSYSYGYDKANRLETAAFKAHDGSMWNKELQTRNEAMQYDHNGNIVKLQRHDNERGLDVTGNAPVITSTPRLIDNLTYSYDQDKLRSVEDASGQTSGFRNGATQTEEYAYDDNGNLTADANKGIAGIVYNFLGKPSVVSFTDGRRIEYTYSAAGTKLAQRLYNNTTLQSTTDYVNGFVYEGGVLQFFGSPEGRVVMNGSAAEYQYAIADHQGNTRVVFSSAPPAPVTYKATFEDPVADGQTFANVPTALPYLASSLAANNTPGGIKVVRLNQNMPVGPAKSVKVAPGDKVDISVWTYYEGAAGFGTSTPSLSTLITSVAGAFSGVGSGAGESGAIFDGVGEALTVLGPGGNRGDAAPAAYLNYILFDQQYNVLDMGWKPATGYNSREQISIPTVNVEEAGYIFVYLSYENESNNYVSFDDLEITHTPTNVIQYNEYYPFGLSTATSWTRENNKNDYLYNAGSELNAASGWYEMFYRGYDPALGRMLQVDPYATLYLDHSSYNYALNNPVMMNDPSGGKATPSPMAWLWSEIDSFYGWSETSTNWGGGGGVGPGSGNHWSDRLSNPLRDYFLMSGSGFQGKYGQSSAGFRQQLIFSMALKQSEGYTGDVWDYGSYGNQMHQYRYENGRAVGLTTYGIYEGGGGVVNEYDLSGFCASCPQNFENMAFGVGTTSLALDLRGSMLNPEIYTNSKGQTGSIYKTNKNGVFIMKNGKPVLKSANAASHVKAANSLGNWGTFVNLIGAIISYQQAVDSGWGKKETSDFVGGMVSFAPTGWIFSSLYFGVQSNQELVKQGVPMQYTPMMIIPGLGPAPVVNK